MQFHAKLLNKYQIAENALALEIEKPFSFKFIPGQNVDIILDDLKGDPKGNRRIFSIASAPSEKNLLVAVRISDSPYKRYLLNSKKNALLTLKGPNGLFKLENEVIKPVVLIAGGIGVAPFRSIILNEKDHDFPHKITLFYSFKNMVYSSFFYTFSNINHAHFTFIPTITTLNQTEVWDGERNRIDQTMIRKYVYDVSEPLYYIAGSKQMVISMRKILMSIGVKAENIKISIFIGF